MKTIYENGFVVMPFQSNWHAPLIFGGEFFAQLDLCAATCVNRFLHDSDCETAVTHKAEVSFMAPCYIGDIIFMKARVVSTGKKSIVVEVIAERERRGGEARDKVVESKFVFVSIEHTKDVASMPQKLPYKDHGLSI
jgi:acyl-CoA thioesterase YciA